MRLLPDGPDIPEALLAAQEQGTVIFLCGAGVSIPAGMPDFRSLALKVYESLGEDPSVHIAENEVLHSRGALHKQYDRLLRLLERRLSASNVIGGGAMREKIREAVREALTPPATPKIATHRALLELSRDTTGKLRLVTTNFDTLFERAWPEGDAAPSHAGPSMPPPKTAAFEGILHLHGRISDPELQLSAIDLVLTSSEFGDAYLRSGWAARYFYDLARAYTVVLVGYAADDPPMRYLLELLEADRERYPDLRSVYAFATCKPNKEHLESALWQAKGVIPIIQHLKGRSYAPFHKTLREWSRYAEDPSAWRRNVLRPLLARSPAELDTPAINLVVQLLSHGDASDHLRELSPAASWMRVFVERGMANREDAPLGQWIAGRLDDPYMISACASLHGLDSRTHWLIEQALDADIVPTQHRRKAWELLLVAKPSTQQTDINRSWPLLSRRLQRGDVNYNSRHIVARMLRPRLSIERPWTLGLDADPGSPESLSSLVRCTFHSPGHTPVDEILAGWPQSAEKEKLLLLTLNHHLIDALDQAADVEPRSPFDRAERDVPSVAPHAQNAYRGGFYPITRAIADLWCRLQAHDKGSAEPILRAWLSSPYTLLRRIGIFAATDPAVPASTVEEHILQLDDHTFWVSGAQVEVMRLLVQRWHELSADTRSNIELRICAGVPRTVFPNAQLEGDEWSSLQDHSSYRRLSRLCAAGCPLTPSSTLRLSELQSRHKSWTPGPGDRDDFHVWIESGSGPSGQPETLGGVADEQLVAEAMRLQRERAYDQGDLWRMFCHSDPHRALRGLIEHGSSGTYASDAWSPFLWTVAESDDRLLLHAVVDQLLSMSDDFMRPLLGPLTTLLQRRRVALSDLTTGGDTRYWSLWDRLADLVYDASPRKEATTSDPDLSTRALDQPGGVLAWTLMESMQTECTTGGAGIPKSYAARLLRFISDTSDSGFLARVQVMRSLAWLDHIAPEWTAETLVPLLTTTRTDAYAYWRAQTYDAIGSSRLFNRLKGDLMTVLIRPDLSHAEADGLGLRPFQVVVRHQRGQCLNYDWTTSELRRALTLGPDVLRRSVSWRLWRLMDDKDAAPAARAKLWSELVGPVFNAIWPLDGRLRKEGPSENLVMMILETGSAFAEAVEAVVPVIHPYRLWDVRLSLRLDSRHEDIDKNYPIPFIRLLNSLIDPVSHPAPFDLGDALERCRVADPAVVKRADYRRLLGISRSSRS